uniref:Reverse transcriptase domain-containing protein n=1 Tax=Oncorhynchus mykiss TaxID=8022 RepID=A0A8K9UN26_ONCMY
MRNRHISNNVRLVLDVLDYSDLITEDSFILFFDFYKAFDTVEHQFLFYSLERLGFGDFFCMAIKTLYANGNSSIKLKYGTSPRFELKRGIRQGCPISPYLFLLITQLLANSLNNSPVQGISIAGKEIIISQLADDTTLFLKDANQIPISINVIQSFSKASGLYLNINKCELIAVKDCVTPSYYGIPVKEELTYLGITITKDQKSRGFLNFNPLIKRTQKKLNQWLQRDSSLKGRVLITKAEGISRLTYGALSLYLDRKISKEIDQMLFNFLWRNRTHYIRKTVVMNTYENGGLNFLDFTTLNNTFKINWIKQFLRRPTSIWNFIPHHVFSTFGGLNFMLFCNDNIDKVPVKLSAFHRQVFLSWSLIYKHNFSPHRYYIWNNRDILYKNTSLFLEYCFRNNILLVSQLVNAEGLLLSYKEFLSLYKVPVTPKDVAIVLDAIPAGVAMLFRNMSRPDPQSLPSIDPVDSSVGKICFSFGPFNNRAIQSLFQQDVVSYILIYLYIVYLIPYVVFIGMDLLIISVGKKFGCCHTHTYLLTKLRKFPLKLFINIILSTTI